MDNNSNIIVIVMLFILIGTMSSKKFRAKISSFYDLMAIFLHWLVIGAKWALYFAIGFGLIYLIWSICAFVLNKIKGYYLNNTEDFWAYAVIATIVGAGYYFYKKNEKFKSFIDNCAIVLFKTDGKVDKSPRVSDRTGWVIILSVLLFFIALF